MAGSATLFASEVNRFLHLIGAQRSDLTDRFSHPSRTTVRKILDGDLDTGTYDTYNGEIARRLMLLLNETRQWIEDDAHQFKRALQASNIAFVQIGDIGLNEEQSGNRSLIVDLERLAGLGRRSRTAQVEKLYGQIALFRGKVQESLRELRKRHDSRPRQRGRDSPGADIRSQPGLESADRLPVPRIPSAVTRILEREVLTSQMALPLVGLLDQALEHVLNSARERRHDFEQALNGSGIHFLNSNEGLVRVHPERLADLYRTRTVSVEITLDIGFDELPDDFDAFAVRTVGLKPEAAWRLLMELLKPEAAAKLQKAAFRLDKVEEGSTRISIEVPKEEAEHIETALREARIAQAGIIGIHVSPSRPGGRFARRLLARNPWINPGAPNAPDVLARSWEAAVRREQIIRPWRRLRWLCSLSPEKSPIASVIRESRERAYALTGLLHEHRKAFRADLKMALIAWPVLTAVLMLLTLLPLRVIYPAIDLWTGMITGITLGLTGGIVCAAVVSPIAVGAGSIAMGWAFGVAHAFAAGYFDFDSGPLGRASVQQDPFMAITGGLVGLSAPQWSGAFPLPLIAGILIGIASAIFAAGWLMAQPERAGAHTVANPSLTAQMKGTVCGSLVGGCIGIVYGLTALFESGGLDRRLAFPIAFALVGGITFAATIRLKGGGPARAAIFGALHAMVTVALCVVSIRSAGAYPSLLALSAATAWYHATWFTGAFVIGGWIGSTRAAVTAATIEGAIGFSIFVVFRMLYG
jgi:hypothetical protein